MAHAQMLQMFNLEVIPLNLSNNNYFMWTLDKWLWLLTLANRRRYWSLILLNLWNEEQATNWSYFCTLYCTDALLAILSGFAVQSLLAVPLFRLASTEEGSSWEHGCAWHQLRTLRKYLVVKRGFRDCCFLTLP